MGNPFEENRTAWLSTTASQIFFMQLGFLAYEVGFCKPVWTQSLILKNVEDTFVGVLIFLCFGYTLSQSEHSFYGIIAIPTNPFLIGISAELHDQILIAAFFASTCATIISGAVLERMKNKVYVIWCLLIILVNYSFISHWVWHKDGWLHNLGFVDGAGAVVVHSTAGMAALVAVWRLGVRDQEQMDKDGKLLPVESASRPIINAMGAFFLWYGWFAFNVSSPIAFSKGIGHAIGTTAMVTVVSPICAACSSFVIMHYFQSIPLTFENLLNCLLAGLVTITGPCHTCDIWESAFIGFSASILYFAMAYIMRYKCHIDDPLQVITIHLFCGLYSCITEGFVGNEVYGTPGLLHGGFKHLGVQILGVVVIAIFNFIVSVFLWDIVMVKCIFRNTEIRVSILDIYLGTRIFDQNYNMALEEVLKCKSNAGKKMLLQFHEFVEDRFASEQLNFLISLKIFGIFLRHKGSKEGESQNIVRYVIQLIDTYIDEHGAQCINISHTQRSILLKFKNQLLMELHQFNERSICDLDEREEDDDDEKETDHDKDKDKSISLIQWNKSGAFQSSLDISKENIFKEARSEIKRIILPLFTQFLRYSFKKDKQKKFAVKIPFRLKDNWMLEWDAKLIKEGTDITGLIDSIPQSIELITVIPTRMDHVPSVSERNQYPVNVQENKEKEKDKTNLEFVMS